MESFKGIIVFTCVLALSQLFAPPLFAEESTESQSMDDVVVTGTRTKERAIDVPVKTEVITREKIEMSGALDLGDLIAKYIPGHYHKYNGLLSPIGLRGFRTDGHGEDLKGYVLLLVDGHRIGTGNSAKINLDRIERVEITKGPSSALYGSAALGGVVNLITQKGDGDLSATLSGEYGSFNYHKFMATRQGEVNDKLRLHLNASYEDISDYKDPEFGKVYNSGVNKKNIGGNLTYAFNDFHELRIGGNYGDLTSESPDWLDDAYSGYVKDNEKHNNKSHGYGDLEYNGIFLKDHLHWRGLVYYLWNLSHYYYGDPTPEETQSKYTDTTLGTDQQLTWKMADWNKIVFGFVLEHMEKKAEAVADGIAATPYTPGLDYDNSALYLQDSLDLLNNRVNVIAAARYDRFEMQTKHPDTGYLPDFNEKNETYDHLSPKLGVGVKFFNQLLRMRANVGQGFKSPSADQLSADHVSNDVRYLGNPDLDPETSLTYDVGFDIYHDNLNFNLSYFHTDYEDKIVKENADVNGVSTQTYVNHGEAVMEGFELGLQWWIGRTFEWNADLSLWANAAFNTTKEDKETGEDLLYISDHELKSGLDLTYRKLTTQLSYTLIGPQKVENYDVYPTIYEDKDSFEFWDLTLRYRFLQRWTAKASILNLFDDRVEWARGYIQPERNYRIGISYTF